MLRSRLLPWFLSASLLFAAACSDSVSAPAKVAAADPAKPVLVTLTGSVRLTGEKLYPVALSTSDGQEIRLTGESAKMLTSVENAGVEVHGQWNSEADNEFLVADFLVRTVDGGAVIDGTLVATYFTPTEIGGDPAGYAIRPTDGGFDVIVSDASPDLLTHLNERLWVAGIEGSGGVPTSYGVIKEM